MSHYCLSKYHPKKKKEKKEEEASFMNVIINFFPLEMFLLRWVHKIPKFPMEKQDSKARRNINHEKMIEQL